jgi:hypothetical protein
MTMKMPAWEMPIDLPKLLGEDEDGMWQDVRWAPILLTVMTGTVYNGRDIPLAWQIEFDPYDDVLATANAKIRSLGTEPDGYGWANVIHIVVGKHHPEILDELNFGDTEIAACVVWVESEATCKLLLEIVWSLIHGT